MAASEGVVVVQLAKEVNVRMTAEIKQDISAALGVAARRSTGKFSHVKVGFLWPKESADEHTVIMQTVAVNEHPADALTKQLHENATVDL